MGKKKNQSLTERISALINRVGDKPEPTFGDIKSELVECLGLAETLQDGAAIRDAEAKAKVLEAENSNLKIELKALNAEVEAFRAEQKQRKAEEKKREMPDIQFEILKGLPNEGVGSGATLDGISERAKIPSYEAAVHLDKLEKAGLAQKGLYERLRVRAIVWHRTIPGSELILAKRLAGETKEQETRKHADLPPIQHEILLLIAAGENDGGNENAIAETLGKTLGLVRYNLKALEDADMAADPGLPDYGAGCTYYLRDTGAEYLAERSLL